MLGNAKEQLISNEQLNIVFSEDPERHLTIKSLFPFQTPPNAIVRNSFVITDPLLQYDTALHQTFVSTFLLPRNDGRILIPAIALGTEHPSLNLSVMLRESAPYTWNVGRRWAVWLGPASVVKKWDEDPDYTPAKALYYLDLARNIKTIFQNRLDGQEIDMQELKILVGKVFGGSWFQHYSQELPDKIKQDPDGARSEVGELFAGFEKSVERAEKRYRELGDNEKLLLNQSFRVVVKARLQRPHIFVSDSIRETIANKPDQLVKSPLEIVSEPRGVDIKQIDSIYIPDQVLGTETYTAFLLKLQEWGIPEEVVNPDSTMTAEIYERCMDNRYIPGRKFSQLIEDGWLVPLVTEGRA